MTRTKATEKSDFWQQLYEQAARYGSPDTPELDWGPDVGLEIISDHDDRAE